MRADDDEALTWDEVSDPTHAAGTPAPVVELVDTEIKPEPVVEPVETKPTTSSFLLVSYGILAGAYLLYTVGWVIGIRQVVFAEVDTLSRILSTASQVLAAASPAIWFGASFVLSRRSKPIVRLLLLLGGLAATIPLPFILLGASS